MAMFNFAKKIAEPLKKVRNQKSFINDRHWIR